MLSSVELKVKLKFNFIDLIINLAINSKHNQEIQTPIFIDLLTI